jgi:hypothetical protein
LLYLGNSKSLEGAIHETDDRDDVQKDSGPQDATESLHLQALRRSNLLLELFKSPSGGPQ